MMFRMPDKRPAKRALALHRPVIVIACHSDILIPGG
jgi:hypothetical protein